MNTLDHIEEAAINVGNFPEWNTKMYANLRVGTKCPPVDAEFVSRCSPNVILDLVSDYRKMKEALEAIAPSWLPEGVRNKRRETLAQLKVVRE